ncbi:hypothetical protein IWQ61_010331, partial [Dispira simplex]
MDGLHLKVLTYQSLIRVTEGADMSNSTQVRVLIRTLLKNLERKVCANIIKDGEMPPLAKVAECILVEVANEEYWAEEEHRDEEDEDTREDQKTGEMLKTKSKVEKSTDINQLMNQFEKMSLNLLCITEEAHSEPEAETAWKDVLYASGLGTVVSTLEGQKTKFTLDDGSEMNLMASDVAEELAQQGKLVIQKDVIWQ